MPVCKGCSCHRPSCSLSLAIQPAPKMMRVGKRQQPWLVHLHTRNVYLAELQGTRGFEWLQKRRLPLGLTNDVSSVTCPKGSSSPTALPHDWALRSHMRPTYTSGGQIPPGPSRRDLSKAAVATLPYFMAPDRPVLLSLINQTIVPLRRRSRKQRPFSAMNSIAFPPRTICLPRWRAPGWRRLSHLDKNRSHCTYTSQLQKIKTTASHWLRLPHSERRVGARKHPTQLLSPPNAEPKEWTQPWDPRTQWSLQAALSSPVIFSEGEGELPLQSILTNMPDNSATYRPISSHSAGKKIHDGPQ